MKTRSVWSTRKLGAAARWRAALTGPAAVVLFFLASLIISSVLTSCSTYHYRMRDVLVSYTGLKSVIRNNMPAGVRSESPNGRTLTSGYFLPKNLDLEADETSAERAYTTVTILGSSRPYSIEILAFRERRSGPQYKSLGEDRELARKVGERIRRALADRREDRNLLDDFRAF